MKNDNLDDIRHSLAHLLAAAVRELYPGAQNAIGPSIEGGFYQDFSLEEQIGDKDLPKIEKKMRELLKKWDKFEKKEVTVEEAKKEFAWNKYKTELIEDFAKEGKDLTFYISNGFVDLCKGGHVESMKDIAPDSFKLDRVAGAYWRGDEKNETLTRIYGLAFRNKKDLKKHLAMLEEAKKRDHRVLGKELGLFTFSDLVGPGLPMFTPEGVVIRNAIENYLEEIQIPRGYQKVWIPHLAKKELYKTSGHWDKFDDSIFKVSSKGEEDFVLKPMNCPHHTQIYASAPRSYRDLPKRYFEVTEMYRDEKPGQLQGLARVRAITIDDAHCFCMPEQVEQEANIIYDIIEEFYKTFGMKIVPRLSLRDKSNLDKYIGDPKKWDSTEKQLRSILKKRTKKFEEIEGEAAFYGPKIDFDAEDVLGRKWQLATIQIDFAMPERFKLEYTNQKGEKETPIMIHRAVSGSLERFMGILIENFTGAFPVWLAPVQVVMLPVSEEQKKYCLEVGKKLRESGIREKIIPADETLGKRIRSAELQKVPYILVIGEKEVKEGAVNVRKRGEKIQSTLGLDKFIDKIQDEIDKRSL